MKAAAAIKHEGDAQAFNGNFKREVVTGSPLGV